MHAPLRIGLVAGEASGDTLGAALIAAIRERHPDAVFFGVGGPKMQAAGCDVWEPADALAVMGLTEILKHLPRLLRLRSNLRARFLAAKPDVFIGIDSPEFNLGLERQLKRAGLKTVQYVSPQVWAWRQGRVKTIGESCDLVLCLLPFEPPFYAEHRVRAEFVGHPLADQIPMQVDRAAARRELGLSPDARVLALLPGSRRGEVERLGADFAAAARALAARVPGLQVIAPMASRSIGDLFRKLANSDSGGSSIRILDGQARTALAACDVAIVASGTATLETALSKRPMVVAYRLGAVTAFLLRRFGLVKVAHFSQPNLLAGRGIVHEYFQEQVTGDALASAAGDWLREPARVAQLEAEFVRIHQQLKVGGASLAAAHILALAGRSPAGER